MTTRILQIDSSLFGGAGVSAQLAEFALTKIKAQYDDVVVVKRDLAADPIPHFDASTIADITDGKAALADTLIAELVEADVLIVGAPMYNFGVPSVLKAWMDHVARAGSTFKYTETGPVGLLSDTKVIVLATRGGIHLGQPSDVETPFIKNFFSFLGLTDIEFVYAEGLNLSGGQREQAITKAEAAISDLVSALSEQGEVA